MCGKKNNSLWHTDNSIADAVSDARFSVCKNILDLYKLQMFKKHANIS